MDTSFGGKRKNGPDYQKPNKKSRVQDVLSEAPREVEIVRYAESHAKEIQVLSGKVDIIGGGKNIAQKVPPHMRRRAMSHNVKRLPRSIRAQATQLVGAKVKKPSRYHRRRPQNLLAEYTRRQRKHIWLETHIWHAKRFHMVDKWGYRLPWKPTMKSERACYRATSKHCLLQDLSYMSCIEIEGPQEEMLKGLKQVTNPDTGQTFAAVSCLAGTREGKTIMYQCDGYPWKAIGPVSFMWNPNQPITDDCENKSANQRQLWIWFHPSMFDEVWKGIIDCLNLKESKLPDKSEKDKLCENKKEPDDKAEPLICDKYKSNIVAVDAKDQVRMKSLTGSLLRYRLTGPQSTAVLVDTLQQANIVPVNLSAEDDSLWWNSYYRNPKFSIGHVTQREYIESMEACQSPSELPPHCIVAMTTRDPRLTRPIEKTKFVSSVDNVSEDMSTFQDKLTTDISVSPLWIENIREQVTTTKVTDFKIHELKSQTLVPGFPLELGDEESRIPVIVIQRPGVTSLSNTKGHEPNLGRGSGFDLLLPKGWGMAFWLALVYRGARCAGLREQECNAYEEKSLYFPNDFPDTLSGCKYQLDLEKEKVEKYNRIPPSKKPNFTKYGVVSPFICPYNLLVKEWKEGNSKNGHTKTQNDSKKENNIIPDNTGKLENVQMVDSDKTSGTTLKSNEEGSDGANMFYVMRNAKLLRKLQNLCQVQNNRTVKKGKHDVKNEILDLIEKDYSDSLIPVRLDMIQKGSPGQFSTICVPIKEDIELLKKNKNYGGPMEPLRIDPVLVEKKELKKQMKQKGLKQKVKVDRTLKLTCDKEHISVRAGCRDVIGYLNSGGYSLGTGNGGGVGFVSSLGLISLIRSREEADSGPIVLVRENTSLQYRFARLCVIT